MVLSLILFNIIVNKKKKYEIIIIKINQKSFDCRLFKESYKKVYAHNFKENCIILFS